MAKNRFLKPRTKADIDERVDRIIRGLGNPEPPLRLADVRELLKLDKVYYTADDPTLMREVVSRIRVATIQVARRPMLIADAIRKFSLQALYAPDSRRIMLDQSLPEKKHRWSEAHEVTHSILPWHEGVMHGDNRHTLSQECHEQIESEANFGAGRLLFLQERFDEQARDMQASLASVKQLKGDFGNTYSSTLWRFVETVGDESPMVGMISCHPHKSRRPADFEITTACRHCIQSPAFSEQFSKISECDLFESISSYCASKLGGPLGASDLILRDDNDDEHRFHFETFFLRYKPPAVGEAITLGVHIGPYTRIIG